MTPLFSAPLRKSVSAPASVEVSPAPKNETSAPIAEQVGEVWDLFFHTKTVPLQVLEQEFNFLLSIVESASSAGRLRPLKVTPHDLNAIVIKTTMEAVEKIALRRLFPDDLTDMSSEKDVADFLSSETASTFICANLMHGVPVTPKEAIPCLPRQLLPHNVKVLSLTNNGLRQLPHHVGEFTNMIHLDISHNCVPSLPRGLLDLPHLRLLSVTGNPLCDDTQSREIISDLRGKGVTVIL